MISIGAVYKGPELHGSRINRLIMTTSAVVEELQGTSSEGPSLKAVFVVPGSLGESESIYLTFGHESNDDGVVVHIPTPRSVANGTDQLKFIVNALHGASAMATVFFEERNKVFPMRQAKAVVTRAAQRIALMPADSI